MSHMSVPTAVPFASRRAARAAGYSFAVPATTSPVFSAPSDQMVTSQQAAGGQQARVDAHSPVGESGQAAAQELPGDSLRAVATAQTTTAHSAPRLIEQTSTAAATQSAPHPTAVSAARAPRSAHAARSARAMTLAALTAVTVIIPISGVIAPVNVAPVAAAGREVVHGPNTPSALDVLTAAAANHIPAFEPATTVTLAANELTGSLSMVKSVLAGCDGVPVGTYVNGKLSASQLCSLDFDPTQMLRPDAAVAMKDLNTAYAANFGRDLCLHNTYRSLSDQYVSSYKYGFMAAKPGTSMHGLGLAVDFCSSVTGDPASMRWLRTNAATFGWVNPDWAQKGNPAYQKYEPWHWEFEPGTSSLPSQK